MLPVSHEGFALGLAGGGGGGVISRTQPTQFGVLTGAHHYHAFPSQNASLKLIRGTRSPRKCKSRSYHTRYCPSWSGTPFICTVTGTPRVVERTDRRAGRTATTETLGGNTSTSCGRRFRERASCHTVTLCCEYHARGLCFSRFCCIIKLSLDSSEMVSHSHR